MGLLRRSPVTVLILVAAIAAVVGGWLLFAQSERQRFVAVRQVRASRSEIRLTLAVDHVAGPIAREEWHMENLDGRSRASYAVTDRHGTRASFDEAIQGYDVTFLFDRLVADGIWELHTRPDRGRDHDIHTVTIDQVAAAARGAHTFRFTDPQYLATTAGRQYHIHLDRDKPVPDLLRLDSTSTADPRYAKIVADFEGFGPPRFKRTVAAARAKLLKPS